MFKNRSFNVKMVKDPEEPEVLANIDPEDVIESTLFGIAALIVVYKVTGLICNTAEHLIVTKI